MLNPGDKQGAGSESLWVESLGHGRYRVRNSPFYVFDLSNEDIVRGREEDGSVKFEQVLIRGGHSTYRLRLLDHSIDSSEFSEYWHPLEKLGCSFEQGPVLSVDVPSNANICKVYNLLEAGEKACVWEFEEGHYGHVASN